MRLVRDWQEGRVSLPPHEVIQNSFHLHSGHVNLQLCDDTESDGAEPGEGAESGGVVKGSMLFQLLGLKVDVYPDQEARSGRSHWNFCNELLQQNTVWSSGLVAAAARTQYLDLPSVSLGGLREVGVVVRVANFTLEALRSGTGGATATLPLAASDKSTFSIPDDVHNPAIQLGLTAYHYPPDCRAQFLGEW